MHSRTCSKPYEIFCGVSREKSTDIGIDICRQRQFTCWTINIMLHLSSQYNKQQRSVYIFVTSSKRVIPIRLFLNATSNPILPYAKLFSDSCVPIIVVYVTFGFGFNESK